jgi:hypothetical protein
MKLKNIYALVDSCPADLLDFDQSLWFDALLLLLEEIDTDQVVICFVIAALAP